MSRTARPSAVTRLALSAVAAVGLAACGSSNGTTPAPSQPQSQAATNGPASASVTAKPITDYAAYLEAKPGKADPSLSPIAVGFVNVQGGAQSFPQATVGAQAAVKMINEEFGGIDGHPLKLVTCFVANAEEEGQRCGQQMANDDSVKVVNFGALIMGNQAFHATLRGKKPVIEGTSTAPIENTTPNTFVLLGDLPHIMGTYGPFAKQHLKASTAALAHPNAPGAIQQGVSIKNGLEKAGIKVKAVAYPLQTRDLVGPVTSAGAQTADVVVNSADVPSCVGFAKALQQTGVKKPVIAVPLCLDGSVAKGLGGDLPIGWFYGVAQTLPQDTGDAGVALYQRKLKQYGGGDAGSNIFASVTWMDMLATVKLMNRVGADKLTPDAISTAAKAFKGPIVMGPPSISCGQFADAPNVCNDQGLFYQYKGKGKFELASGWLRSPR
jgi:ABC-type branched-subunit amino acid transport system substrate-binding protein